MKGISSKQSKMSQEISVYLMLIGLFLIQVANPLRVDSLVSLGTWLIVISAFFSFAMAIIEKRTDNKCFLYCVILAIAVLLSVVLLFSVEYQTIVVAVCFMEIPFFFASFNKCNSKSIVRAIYACFVLLSIAYNIFSTMPIAHIYYDEYGQRQMKFLTLGYNNPNETAMYLFSCIIVLVVLCSKLKSHLLQLTVLVDIVTLLRLLILTQSRTAMLGCSIFIIWILFFQKWAQSKYARRLSLLVPLFFVLLSFLNQTWDLKFNVLSENIDTGRSDIYMRALKNANLFHLIFGQFSFQFQNLHNAYWSIFATIGIVGFGAFFLLLNLKLYEIQKMIQGGMKTSIALIGLFSITIYTSTEAAFFTAGGAFATAVISIFLLCIFDERNSE